MSDPYDASLLHPLVRLVCTMAWLTPGSLKYTVLLQLVRRRRHRSRSVPPPSTIISYRISWRRCYQCSSLPTLRSLLFMNELKRKRLSRKMIVYSTLLHRCSCRTAQPNGISHLIEVVNFLRLVLTKVIVGHRRKRHFKWKEISIFV